MAEKKSFESSLKKLESIVARLEDGELSLEDALACFEEGVKAATNCQKLLRDAELKIEALRIGEGGELVTDPFSEDDDGDRN